jgi:hypothetical protein
VAPGGRQGWPRLEQAGIPRRPHATAPGDGER